MVMPWIQEQGSSAKQSQGRATEVDRKKLELAFETLATSNDPKAVNRSLAVFGKAGFEAVPFLASKVSDQRIPPVQFSNRQVAGQPSMGDHAFWGVQGILEPAMVGDMRLTAVPRACLLYTSDAADE